MTDTTLARRGGQQQAIAEQAPQQRGLTFGTISQMTGYDLGEIALIRHKMATSMNIAPDEVSLYDLALYARATKKLDLDPLLNQIHWIARGGKGGIQTGIDGLRALADRSGCYAGSEAPNFRGAVEVEISVWEWRNRQRVKTGTKRISAPEYCQVIVWRIVQGHKVAFTGEARWDEFYPGERNGSVWHQMPRHMLAKCAEAQALRKAFPAQLAEVDYGESSDGGPLIVDEVASSPRIVEQPSPPPRREATASDYDRTIGAEYAEQDRGWASSPEEGTDEDMEVSPADLELQQKADALMANKDLVQRAQAAGKKGLGKHTADPSWDLHRVIDVNRELAALLTPAQAEAEPAGQTVF